MVQNSNLPIQAIPEWEDLNEKDSNFRLFSKKMAFPL